VALVDNVLQLLPNTKRIVFVLGNSAIEQFWVRVVRDELKRFEGRVAIEIPHTLSLEQLEQQVSALPSDAAVFFAQIYVDGANVSREQHVTLARLRAASRVPIFGLYESQFGNGIVGGPLISEKAVAVMTADIAARMVDGRALTPGPRTLPLGVPIYDARELSRWSIPDSRLPQPQEVRFRMPTLWQQYRWQIVAAASLLVLQSLLLVGLLLQRARRRRAEQEARQLNGRILGAQEEERRRLGRELHDDVTPRLARLAIEARRLQGPALVAQGFPMHDELVRLSEDVHAFSYRLHPTVLDDLGLVDALQAECDRWARGQQLQVLFSARDVAESPATETATALFRIAQESLRNANRHAQARRVDVTLAPQDGGLRLSVHDDGIGIDDGAIDTQPGLGLASMHARAHQVGGWLQILGEPGAGTTVIAWVPARASA
jgi:signal transduction histidine kinase